MKLKKTLILAAVAAVACTALLGQPFGWYNPPITELIRHELKDGKLYLTWRSTTEYLQRFPVSPAELNSTNVWLEVYSCSNGIVVLEQ